MKGERGQFFISLLHTNTCDIKKFIHSNKNCLLRISCSCLKINFRVYVFIKKSENIENTRVILDLEVFIHLMYVILQDLLDQAESRESPDDPSKESRENPEFPEK